MGPAVDAISATFLNALTENQEIMEFEDYDF